MKLKQLAEILARKCTLSKLTSVNAKMTNLAEIGASKMTQASMDTPKHMGHSTDTRKLAKAGRSFSQVCWIEENKW